MITMMLNKGMKRWVIVINILSDYSFLSHKNLSLRLRLFNWVKVHPIIYFIFSINFFSVWFFAWRRDYYKRFIDGQSKSWHQTFHGSSLQTTGNCRERAMLQLPSCCYVAFNREQKKETKLELFFSYQYCRLKTVATKNKRHFENKMK